MQLGASRTVSVQNPERDYPMRARVSPGRVYPFGKNPVFGKDIDWRGFPEGQLSLCGKNATKKISCAMG